MRYIVWAVRLVVFVVVLLFALKNTGPVDVNFYADHTVSGVPLIVVMLAFLVPLAVAFGGFLTVDILGTEGYFSAVAVLFGVLSAALTRWLDTRGARRFEQL